MKKLIFVVILFAFALTGFSQQKKNEVRWRDLQSITLTGGTNITITGTYPSWTFTPSLTPAFTTVGVGAQVLSQINTNKAAFNNSLKVTDTLFVGGNQFLLQTTINKLKTEGSLWIVDTLNIGTVQHIMQTTINKLKTEGSLGVTDTLFIGTNQYVMQSTINKLKFEGSVWVVDTLAIGTNQWIMQTTVNRLKIEGSLSTGASDSIATGHIEAVSGAFTGNLNPAGRILADSTIYFGDDYKKTWKRFAYQQVGIPASRLMLENIADISIQDKAGTGVTTVIQRDTSLTSAGVNHLNIVKQVFLGKDTTGIGSTANIGTTLYYNGHFYGLIAGEPPVWKQLDN